MSALYRVNHMQLVNFFLAIFISNDKLLCNYYKSENKRRVYYIKVFFNSILNLPYVVFHINKVVDTKGRLLDVGVSSL